MRRALPLMPAEIGGQLISISLLGLVPGPAITASPVLSLGLRLIVGL
ncbi:hypothetical protein [Ancylobacter defluvii]|uniref:Uncharacterized protein n=1 Tax=Ancylobacter defluvii TaxID=1282440 RepID=A0A9W6JX83_9HYPH|nr:hypothetical protein [Ancylobacter defluvii]MBS7589324.1 hypothetical protein [Ancylobacter defluvii]GLK84937.1 hypothetical protein GCM10017653_30070 [Ancylobacter defluvii]